MKVLFATFFLTMSSFLTVQAQTVPIHAEGLQEELIEVQIDEGFQRAVISKRKGQTDASKLLVLIPGYPSVVKAEMGDGIMLRSPLLGNFLIRARRHLVTNNVATLLIDCHTSVGDICTPEYQASQNRYKHIKSVIEAAKSKLPSIKQVYLLSTSAGTISSAFVSKFGQSEFAGVIHTSTIDPLAPGSYIQLKDFNYSDIKIQQAFIHHVEDPCGITKFSYIRAVAEKYNIPLISVNGGNDFRGPNCGAFTQHGFRNKEMTVARQILKMLESSFWISEEI
jgi:hypothetical protein